MHHGIKESQIWQEAYCTGGVKARELHPAAGVHKVGIMVKHSEVSEKKKYDAIRAVFQCKKSRKRKYTKIRKGREGKLSLFADYMKFLYNNS